MTSLFKGAGQAQHYATCRPTYPKALYDTIAARCGGSGKDDDGKGGLCIDVGCGTGQATLALTDYFDSVMGIDPSPTQLQHAVQHARMDYRLGTANEHLSSMPSASVQCLTSAQAVHWLDIPTFYQEVRRVLQPGGCLALWTYGMPTFPNHATLEAQVLHIYNDILDDYWDPRRKLVEDLYKDIPLIDTLYPDEFLVGERIQDRPDLDIRQDVTGAQLAGYIRSWSGYTKYCQEHNVVAGSDRDPVQSLQELLAADAQTTCVWPVAMLLSVKKK